MFNTANGYTKQKIIDKINSDFKGKAVRAIDADEKSICAYLTHDGKKCAVGLFIPDGHDAQSHEGGYQDLMKNHSETLQTLMSMEDTGMTAFQSFHDVQLKNSETVETQKARLIEWILKNVVDA